MLVAPLIFKIMDIKLTITKKQQKFINATEDEVLYGGAAGGGKSFGQVVDAFLTAMKYAGIRQLILRTTFPELERSLIITALKIIPRGIYKYNSTKHIMTFKNGSVIEFGYLSSDSAVTMYQSAEYDIIRFDELTHFSEFRYTYMQSRIRGVNNFPKQIKSTTNPGSEGHGWVKKRFIEPMEPEKVFDENGRKRVFIPARVQDNNFIMESDPEYIKRLEILPENEKRALLYGDWDIFEGQYFREFDRQVHVIEPFEIPAYWQRFRCMDYGLDMCACLWCATDTSGNVYVYREFCESGLILSEAAEKIKEIGKGEKILYTVASPDLWNRRQDTGRSGMEIMATAGLLGLIKADDRRVEGWRNMKEYLRAFDDGSGKSARLKIFSSCREIIRCMPLLVHDKHNGEDCSSEPHDITHAPEALRYGLMSRPISSREIVPLKGNYTKGELEDMKKENGTHIRRR